MILDIETKQFPSNECKLYEWTDEKIDFYARASNYTGFHANLADIIIPMLRSEDRVTDLGCGTGLIDMFIAPSVRSVTCVDIDENALRFLKGRIDASGLQNIKVKAANLSDGYSDFEDITLLCYFGASGDQLVNILGSSARLTIAIMHMSNPAGNPSGISKTIRKPYADEMQEFLMMNERQFNRRDLCLNFGQPLKSKEEARRFLEIYCAETEEKARERQINLRLEKLQFTDDKDYPCFYPYNKEVSIFFIERSV